MLFSVFVSFIILLWLGQVYLSYKNKRWLLKNGAVEYGKNHYPFAIVLPVLFILSMVVEYRIRGVGDDFSTVWLFLFLILLFFDVWIIYTLGNFWSLKIYRICDFPLVKAGPYKCIKHPHYLILIGEVIAIPLVFHLYVTAIIFSILNGIFLFVRIRDENQVLKL
ncbi:MAG: hypothetical protein LUG18_15970 [Candidatus Azobacteroides sp.]|nr:hypothetical protein [Candidatus Azobacteroides sp.]